MIVLICSYVILVAFPSVHISYDKTCKASQNTGMEHISMYSVCKQVMYLVLDVLRKAL